MITDKLRKLMPYLMAGVIALGGAGCKRDDYEIKRISEQIPLAEQAIDEAKQQERRTNTNQEPVSPEPNKQNNTAKEKLKETTADLEQEKLSITKFDLCTRVDEEYNCIGKTTEFPHGEKVYFRFTVRTSAYNGRVSLQYLHTLTSPTGGSYIQRISSPYETKTQKREVSVNFSDCYTPTSTGNYTEEFPPGDYTLRLEVVNSLLDRKIIRKKKFRILPFQFIP